MFRAPLDVTDSQVSRETRVWMLWCLQTCSEDPLAQREIADKSDCRDLPVGPVLTASLDCLAHQGYLGRRETLDLQDWTAFLEGTASLDKLESKVSGKYYKKFG